MNPIMKPQFHKYIVILLWIIGTIFMIEAYLIIMCTIDGCPKYLSIMTICGIIQNVIMFKILFILLKTSQDYYKNTINSTGVINYANRFG